MRTSARTLASAVLCCVLVACGGRTPAAPSAAATWTPVSMTGLVLDADTGAPIAGATLTFLTSPGSFANDGMTTVTDGDGRYRFDRVFTANSNIGIAAPGYQEWRTGLRIDGPTARDFELRGIPVPQTFTGSVGGPRSTWTCITQVNLFPGRGGPTDVPCQDFPFTMRRTGAADLTVTWTGTNLMMVQVNGSAFSGYGGSGSNGRIDLTMSYLPAGNFVARVVNAMPNDVPTRMTITLVQRD